MRPKTARFARLFAPLFALYLVAAGCGAPASPATPPETPPALTVGETRQIVPGPGLPVEYTRVPGLSNNNLDVTRHDGRVFLATRKAPDHFASTETRLFVFSSTDEKTWDFEAEVSMGTDVREPRLLSFKGRLHLFFAQLGDKAGAFEPRGMFRMERTGPATWSKPEPFYRGGEPYIPWRAKVRGGVAYLVVYKNGQYIYDFSGRSMDIEMLASSDGQAWAPLDPARPVVSSGGGSETDWDFDEKGDLYAVIRNEAGDATGWGSKICRAKKGALSTWECAHDPKKYDSPLVFSHRGQILLVGRRHVTASGRFELDDGEPWSAATTVFYQGQYWIAPKRCSLWLVDRAALKVRLIGDVPGWGDTCFASLLDDAAALPGPDDRVLYNYSSPLDDPQNGTKAWQKAQEGETRIYRTAIKLTAPADTTK